MSLKTDSSTLLGYSLNPIVLKVSKRKNFKKQAQVIVYDQSRLDDLFKADFLKLNSWQKNILKEKKEEFFVFSDEKGPLFFVGFAEAGENNLWCSDFGKARDQLGEACRKLNLSQFDAVHIDFWISNEEQILGGLVGLELSQYRFQKENNEIEFVFYREGKRCKKDVLQKAGLMGVSTNIARHLVNMPSTELNPVTYAQALKQLFSSFPHVTVSVWDVKRLEKEKMGFILGVGRAGAVPPRFVHIRYSPPLSKGQPIALVGKGITFDSGGMDLKPSQFMRWMKKDMGGSATVVGLAYCLVQSQSQQSFDAYLPLAENMVSSHSYRPGDVLIGRSGSRVEIHNTDAEGRLVLADALFFASSQTKQRKPKLIIDVATLTGAVRVALGTGVGGLFSNDVQLETGLKKSSDFMQDHLWPLPLYKPYFKQLESSVADFTNASSSGLGGGITAALFLQNFVGDLPWAHLDIFAWADSVSGGYSEIGGSGQAVQALIHFIEFNL